MFYPLPYPFTMRILKAWFSLQVRELHSFSSHTPFLVHTQAVSSIEQCQMRFLGSLKNPFQFGFCPYLTQVFSSKRPRNNGITCDYERRVRLPYLVCLCALQHHSFLGFSKKRWDNLSFVGRSHSEMAGRQREAQWEIVSLLYIIHSLLHRM